MSPSNPLSIYGLWYRESSASPSSGLSAAELKLEGRGCLWTLRWGTRGPQGDFSRVALPSWDVFLVFNSCSWLVKSWCTSSNSICCFRAEILSCNSFLGSKTAIPRTPSGRPGGANGGGIQKGGHSGSYLTTSSSKLSLSDWPQILHFGIPWNTF